MATFLPAPVNQYIVHADSGPAPAVAKPKAPVPPYGQRQKFVPRSYADFGDGGAFPEVHVAQYPLGMGKPGSRAAAPTPGGGAGAAQGAIVAVDVDAEGRVKHDAIVRQGTNRDKIVQTQLHSVKEKPGDSDKLAAPTADEEAATAERTRLALEKIVGGKVAASTPAGALGQALEVCRICTLRLCATSSARCHADITDSFSLLQSTDVVAQLSYGSNT
jgi:SNW domain-containing protein 1